MARLLRWCGWAVAACVVVMTLAGFAGGWFWVFDLAANFRVQLFLAALLVGVIGVVVGLRARERLEIAAAGIVLLCAVINLVVIAPLWTGGDTPPADSAQVIVGHLNMQGRRGDSAGFIDMLRARGVDVFVVLDAQPGWVTDTDGSLGPYRIVAGPPGTATWVFTKIAIGNVTHPDLAGMPPAAVQFDAHVGAADVAVLSLHTQAPTSAGNSAARDDSLRAVARWAQAHEQGRAIVTGDLNATMWSSKFRDLVSATALQDSEHGFGFQPSFPVRFRPVAVPIDQSLHSPTLATRGRDLGAPFGSGHNSLIVNYSLQP